LLADPTQKTSHFRFVAEAFEGIQFVVKLRIGKQRVDLAVARAANANCGCRLARLKFRARREMVLRQMFQVALAQGANHVRRFCESRTQAKKK